MMNRNLMMVFFVGLGLGVVGGVLAPRLLAPHLPTAGLSGDGEGAVRGVVTAKSKKADRLLVTVVGAEGAVLVTFEEKIEEIDLLVEEGDTLALDLGGYKPFVSDPTIRAVMKPKAGKAAGPGAAPDTAMADTTPRPRERWR